MLGIIVRLVPITVGIVRLVPIVVDSLVITAVRIRVPITVQSVTVSILVHFTVNIIIHVVLDKAELFMMCHTYAQCGPRFIQTMILIAVHDISRCLGCIILYGTHRGTQYGIHCGKRRSTRTAPRGAHCTLIHGTVLQYYHQLNNASYKFSRCPLRPLILCPGYHNRLP